MRGNQPPLHIKIHGSVLKRKGEICTPLAPDRLLGEKRESQEVLEVILVVMEKRARQDSSGGRDGMRDDGMGIGDIREVSGDAWVS